MALLFNGMGPQNSGDSSNKSITIQVRAKYQAPLNSLFVVLPSLLAWLNSSDIERRREAIGQTFACYSWEEVVAQAHEVYAFKSRTLRIASEQAFLEQIELIHYYHTAARHALTRK
ncbi:MAG: hypothetical protein ACRYG7_31895 [Janthinobacterium lividum]